MSVVTIAMLRGVNVGGHNKIKMEALRDLCGSLQMHGARTLIQSGNVVFRTDETDASNVGNRFEDAIEKNFGFRPAVILRTRSELIEVLARNPFAARDNIEPSRLLISFLEHDPSPEICDQVRAKNVAPEELHITGREMYTYFPNGMARPKIPMAAIEKALKVPVTARNWNTVMKLAAMAEELEESRQLPSP